MKTLETLSTILYDAADAADAAAYAAAYAAADAAYDAKRSEALAKCAVIVRKHLPFKMLYAAYGQMRPTNLKRRE